MGFFEEFMNDMTQRFQAAHAKREAEDLERFQQNQQREWDMPPLSDALTGRAVKRQSLPPMEVMPSHEPDDFDLTPYRTKQGFEDPLAGMEPLSGTMPTGSFNGGSRLERFLVKKAGSFGGIKLRAQWGARVVNNPSYGSNPGSYATKALGMQAEGEAKYNHARTLRELIEATYPNAGNKERAQIIKGQKSLTDPEKSYIVEDGRGYEIPLVDLNSPEQQQLMDSASGQPQVPLRATRPVSQATDNQVPPPRPRRQQMGVTIQDGSSDQSYDFATEQASAIRDSRNSENSKNKSRKSYR